MTLQKMSLIQRPTGVTKATAAVIDNMISDTIIENKIQPGTIKTDRSDRFPIFTILKKYSYNSPEKTNIIQLISLKRYH